MTNLLVIILDNMKKNSSRSIFNGMKKIIKISSVAALLLPSFAFAATFESVTGTINSLIYDIAPILMGIAFAYFLYGIIMYIKAGGDDIGKSVAKHVIINGVIGLFVMLSVWGIVKMLQLTFDVGGSTRIQIHNLP